MWQRRWPAEAPMSKASNFLANKLDIYYPKEKRLKNIRLIDDKKQYWTDLTIKGNPINPKDISILFVPAIAIDKEGYRLGYGGGYFDRLRQKDLWLSIPSFVVISNNCISKTTLPRDKWDVPFNGWISEKGLHQIEATK